MLKELPRALVYPTQFVRPKAKLNYENLANVRLGIPFIVGHETRLAKMQGQKGRITESFRERKGGEQ